MSTEEVKEVQGFKVRQIIGEEKANETINKFKKEYREQEKRK